MSETTIKAPYPIYADEDEIDLLDLWNILWKARAFIIGVTLICTLAAVFYSLFMLPPPIFKSEAVLRSLKKDSGNISKLAGLMGNLPIPLDIAGNNEGSDILTFLNSRNLKIRLIEKFNLLVHMNPGIWDEKAQKWSVEDPEAIPTTIMAIQQNLLQKTYQVIEDKKSGLISISWLDKDPVFACEMVKRVVAELTYYLENEFDTTAKREREFIDRQLTQITRELEHWERQVPSKKLPLARIQRERLAAQTVYTELRKQLELAKINEARELTSFKIIDEPFVPERGIRRSKRLICTITLIMSGFCSVFIVFCRHFVTNLISRKNVTIESNPTAP